MQRDSDKEEPQLLPNEMVQDMGRLSLCCNHSTNQNSLLASVCRQGSFFHTKTIHFHTMLNQYSFSNVQPKILPTSVLSSEHWGEQWRLPTTDFSSNAPTGYAFSEETTANILKESFLLFILDIVCFLGASICAGPATRGGESCGKDWKCKPWCVLWAGLQGEICLVMV